MPSYNIKLVNDNGAKTGCGTSTLTIKATDRKKAQEVGLKYMKDNGGTESSWRLHDDERNKA